MGADECVGWRLVVGGVVGGTASTAVAVVAIVALVVAIVAVGALVGRRVEIGKVFRHLSH